MQDVYQLSVGQILRKDFRKWTRTGKAKSRGSRSVVSDVGMSAIVISLPQLLSSDETSIPEIVLFQQSEKLRLLIIVTGYDHRKNIKEMLISAESEDLLKDLLLFLDSHAPQLKRHATYQPVVMVNDCCCLAKNGATFFYKERRHGWCEFEICSKYNKSDQMNPICEQFVF